jgi:predicted ATPase
MKDETIHKPILGLTKILVRKLRGLSSVDLPADGLSWESKFPPVSIVAGANGSGKTTLLRCIAHAARLIASQPTKIPDEVDAAECRLDFLIGDSISSAHEVRFLVGSEGFIREHESPNCYGYTVTKTRPAVLSRGAVAELRRLVREPAAFAASTLPRIVFLPSDTRDLVVPRVKYKAPGRLEDTAGFVAWWERPADNQWAGSTLELLFSARWADLNAKEEGHPEKADNFDRFVRAFGDLTAGRKRLGWTTKGELIVELNGASHPVQDLSSGERQALLILTELQRLWRPGSLVLIDELELHLHDAWQGRLYEAICAMQRELGGQVLLATQSHSLFEMAAPGTRALLGRASLQ